jgi:50S ribosomal subunit-associated GTPase HflX
VGDPRRTRRAEDVPLIEVWNKIDLRELVLGFGEGKRRAWLHEEGVVLSEEQREDGFHLSLRWTPRQEKRFREL